MIDPVSIGGMLEGLRAAVGLAKTAADAAVDVKVKEAIFQIRETLYELQERALNDQQSRIELVSQLDQARRELAAERGNKAALDNYELVEIAKGRLVYRSKTGEPPHFACPNCRSVHQLVAVLQVDTGYGNDGNETMYKCTACSFRLMV